MKKEWKIVPAANGRKRYIHGSGAGWIDDRRDMARCRGFAVYAHGAKPDRDLSEKLVAVMSSLSGAKSRLQRIAGGEPFQTIAFPWYA